MDCVVLDGPLRLDVLAALRALPVAVLMLVASDAEIPAARAAGFEATVSRGGAVTGADIVLSERGVARLVGSADQARAAFASGAELVLYDLPAMLGVVAAGLTAGRPPAAAAAAREPLVLLSGMLGDAGLWDDVAAELADVALPWPVRIDRDDSVPELASAVLAQMPPRCAVAGHSLGAVVALEMMRQAPQRISRLALLNASGRGPVPAQLQAWQRWRQRTEAGEFPGIVDELARATLAAPRRRDEALVARNAQMAATVGADGFLRQLAAQTTRPDSLPTAADIDVAVLVVAGELDEICPPGLQRELVEHCPRARLATVPGAGHMLPLEAPHELAVLMRSWLADGAGQ